MQAQAYHLSGNVGASNALGVMNLNSTGTTTLGGTVMQQV